MTLTGRIDMNGYVAFYNGMQYHVEATSSYAACEKAKLYFKPAKSKAHMVHVMLAEVEGKQVTHTFG